MKICLFLTMLAISLYGTTAMSDTNDKAVGNSASEKEGALGQEVIEPNEEALIEGIRLITEERMRRSYGPGEVVQRDAHAKTHGLVCAKFTVLDDLPKNLRYGVFAEPKTFDALIRFSAASQIAGPDTSLQPHGMAMKILGVDGEKIVAPAPPQDFVMINFPIFFANNLPDYIDFMRFTSAGSVAVYDGVDPVQEQMNFAEKHPGITKIVQQMATTPFYNPVQVQYWSETPYKLGPNAIKYSARPLTSRENKKPAGQMGESFLRDALVSTVGKEVVQFEFLVQVQNNAKTQPIEDPTIEWKESESVPQRVALIEIPVQDISANGNLMTAEKLAFSVWNSLEAHRPLGSMNRTRRVVYESSMKVRNARNHNVRFEPTDSASICPLIQAE